MTIDLYPEIIRRQDLSPDKGFGTEIDEDCKTIHDATKGFGANKQRVIDTLATKDATARWKLSLRFKDLYPNDKGGNLAELMKSEFSGDFGQALTMLAMPLDEAECYMLRKATKGIGCNVSVVYSVLCGRVMEELTLVKKKFFDLYSKDLTQLMASELRGDMERLIINSLQAGEQPYDPQFHTDDKAKEDAEIIYKKGQGRWGTDEKGIFKILCAAPPEYISKISAVYTDKYGYTLWKAMEKELSGNVRDGTLHMLGMKLKPYETIAKLIKSACAGIGTDELLLTCCIIRYQHVMKDVMTAHIELFGKTVHDRVREETSGKYKEVLLAILNAAWPEHGE
ncbi:annexin [Nitzschia inconspicua]|uniref:Annexin n=1 Tax=Nitzschia inconspicua TaxID=303405 RepID=A0A9K3M681_9STRA|nr:annexin [Nitzschia inconspicua]